MNETIQTQLNHRTIRAFKDQPLTKEEVDLLVEVAQRTASSMYLQAYSIISVTDPELKKALRQLVDNHMWQLADIYSCLWWTNVVIRKLQKP